MNGNLAMEREICWNPNEQEWGKVKEKKRKKKKRISYTKWPQAVKEYVKSQL